MDIQGGPVLAQFAKQEIETQLWAISDHPEVRRLLPSEYRYIRFAWGKTQRGRK